MERDDPIIISSPCRSAGRYFHSTKTASTVYRRNTAEYRLFLFLIFHLNSAKITNYQLRVSHSLNLILTSSSVIAETACVTSAGLWYRHTHCADAQDLPIISKQELRNINIRMCYYVRNSKANCLNKIKITVAIIFAMFFTRDRHPWTTMQTA